MKERPRILVIDTVGGAEMQEMIQKQFPEEVNVRVVLADTHHKAQMLCWAKKRRRGWRTLRPWRVEEVDTLRHFDCAVINASSDLRNESNEPDSPVRYALTLAENKTPVLVYSPDYTGRLQKLQNMVECPRVGAFNPHAIPEVARLSLEAPATTQKIIVLLRQMRLKGIKAEKAKKHLQKLLRKMEEGTRELCIQILLKNRKIVTA